MPGNTEKSIKFSQPLIENIKLVTENSPDPLVVLTPEGSIIACNKPFCRLFDCSPDDIYLNLPTPALLDGLKQIVADIQQGAVCQHLNMELNFPQGTRFFNAFIFPQYDQSGTPPYYLVSLYDITEQKLLLNALHKSEKIYRLLTENAFDMITIINLESNQYKYISPSHAKVLGFTAQDLLGNNWTDLIHPDDLEGALTLFRRGIAEGSGSAVYRHKHKNGDYVWLLTVGYLITDPEYQGDALFIARNITQLKQTEERLKESEQKYRLITNNSQDLILLLNPVSMACTFASPSISRILGYQESEVLGSSVYTYVHPSDLPLVTIATRRYTFKSQDNVIQYRLKRKDGTYLWAESVGKMFKNNKGKRQLLLSIRDISERKWAEETLKASEARLREREKELKYQLDYVNYLINNMNEIFAIYDREGIITFVNDGIKKPLGYEPHELIGRPAINLVAGSQKSQLLQQIRTSLLKPGPDTMEVFLQHKHGGEVLVRIKSSSIIENGELSGVMLLIEDISEHRKLEREMARLDRLNTVGEMAASIGHEIRNPMTTVRGFLQLMSLEAGMEHYHSYFSIMLEELSRANSIISEFLSLAKNKLVDLQQCSLNNIINSIYPLLQADALLADKNVVLALEEIPNLLLDSAEIRQLLVNLVRNGLEAMSAGGKVHIMTYQEGPEVVLKVQDEGSGIDPSLLDKLGTPFLTTKVNGTGLGLAICYSIVDRHNAAIEPVTGPEGTTVIIRFPIPASK